MAPMPNLPAKALARAASALCLLALSGCGGGQVLTPQAIRASRQTWQRADLRDYDLEWTTSGAQTGHYRVSVRGGEVRSVRTVLPDGREIETRTAQPESYGVDGLFQILEEELAQLGADQPFGQPPGTTAALWFDPDPQLGYPRRYRRDVVGAPQGVAIDVIRLIPASGVVPAPSSGGP
jgi:Family of unknown function (DUF6174)